MQILNIAIRLVITAIRVYKIIVRFVEQFANRKRVVKTCLMTLKCACTLKEKLFQSVSHQLEVS